MTADTGIEIRNDGQRITSTNYFDSRSAAEGLFYLSIHAGAFRLLIPPAQEIFVPEIQASRKITITRGTWEGTPDAMELVFDTETNTPTLLFVISRYLIDRLPFESDIGKKCPFLAYTGNPLMTVFAYECTYQVTTFLPPL